MLQFWISPRIRAGQRVLLSYTDPTSGDDAQAIQDLAGNDLATFENRAIGNQFQLHRWVGQAGDCGNGAGRRDADRLAGDDRDDDGLTTATYSYQWIRQDGQRRTDIPGATSDSYTLVAADEGKRFRVRASFADDRGHPETRTSDATGAVEVAATAPKITIAPDRSKATGRLDWIRYRLAREGPATGSLTVRVTLEPPAGHDWIGRSEYPERRGLRLRPRCDLQRRRDREGAGDRVADPRSRHGGLFADGDAERHAGGAARGAHRLQHRRHGGGRGGGDPEPVLDRAVDGARLYLHRERRPPAGGDRGLCRLPRHAGAGYCG